MNKITLPEEWLLTKFTEVLDIQGGTQPPKAQFISEPQEGYVRLLQIRDFGARPVPTFVPDTLKLKKCDINDVLIGRYGASLGRICTGMKGAYNVALAKVMSGDYLHKPFLKAYLESEMFQQPLALLSRSAQNGFNKDDLAAFNFALIPIAEQKVIADKLDTLLAQVDTTKARLERIPQILKTFRQSVLAAAVSGKLISVAEPNVITIGEVTTDIRYGTSKKCDYKGGQTPVIRIPNIGDRKLDASDLKYADFTEKELKTLALKAGDLLVIRSNGSLDLVAKPALVDHKYEGFLYAGYLIRIRCNQKMVLPGFLLNVISSSVVRNVVEINTRSTSGVNNINSKELASLEFVLPSIEEQTEIVRRVEELFAFADRIEQKAAVALERVNNLTQSILAKAFRGELTADWRAANPELIRGENSAEALLKKIQAEREALSLNKKSRTRENSQPNKSPHA